MTTTCAWWASQGRCVPVKQAADAAEKRAHVCLKGTTAGESLTPCAPRAADPAG